jgi:hypothetical protein
VNYNFIKRLINYELPSMVFKKNHKCEIYIKLKFTKPSFQTIKKSSDEAMMKK